MAVHRPGHRPVIISVGPVRVQIPRARARASTSPKVRGSTFTGCQESALRTTSPRDAWPHARIWAARSCRRSIVGHRCRSTTGSHRMHAALRPRVLGHRPRESDSNRFGDDDLDAPEALAHGIDLRAPPQSDALVGEHTHRGRRLDHRDLGTELPKGFARARVRCGRRRLRSDDATVR